MASLSEPTKKTASSLTNKVSKVMDKIVGGRTTPVESEKSPAKLLGAIYELMVKMDEDKRLHEELQQTYDKEDASSDKHRHEELIKALTGRRKKPEIKKEVKEKKEKVKKEPETKAPETKAKAPETKAKAPETKAKAPETEAKAPETEAKAPETKTKAPETEAKAPEVKVAEPPKTTAEPVKQVQPPKATTEPVKQVEPPKTTAEPVKQVQPPKATTEPVKQVEPPKATTEPSIPSNTAATAAKVTPSTLTGRAAMLSGALIGLGITNKSAITAIVAASAKESQLDPFKPEAGAKPWLNTLNGKPKVVNGKTLSPLEYIYTKFPQLGPGGRVSKQLSMPDGVPEDYIRQIMAKGDESWFTFVYPGGPEAYKYRGRGLLQITGKSVYEKVGKIIGIDLLNDPDAVTRDFTTAARAAGAYLMDSLGRGDSKKGLESLNSFENDKDALKVVIANVASGNIGTDKQRIDKLFNPDTNLGKTTASQLEAAGKYSNLGTASVENKDLKQSMDKPPIQTTNNTMVNVPSSTTIQPSVNKDDDRPPILNKR